MNATKAKPQAGFTLIELLIVMAIIGMLAALVGPSLMDKIGGAKADSASAQITMLGQALDAYKLDVGKYPKTLDGLLKNDSGSKLWSGPYLKKNKIPADPWGNEYIYHYPGRHNKKSYDLSALGADGAEGGEGDNADIRSWE